MARRRKVGGRRDVVERHTRYSVAVGEQICLAKPPRVAADNAFPTPWMVVEGIRVEGKEEAGDGGGLERLTSLRWLLKRHQWV